MAATPLGEYKWQKIELFLTVKQSAVLDRLARTTGMASSELLDKVKDKAVSTIEEMIRKSSSRSGSSGPERGLENLAAFFGEDLETLKNNVLDSRKAVKYVPDRVALEGFRQHIRNQRAKR